MKLSELAGRTGARADEKDSDLEIRGAAGLDEAEAGHVTFLANPRYTPRLQTTRASAVYVGEGVELGREDIAALRAPDPYLAYTRALRVFHPEAEFEPFIHPSAVVDPTARLGEGVAVGACAVIGRDVRIGDRVRIFPNVTVYDGVRVVVEDDVEIGAGTTIDRASVGETRLARGAKIDNLVQVGHSCTVGEDALLCAQVGLAGSSRVGRRVILAGQVGVAGHLEIGDDVVLTAKSATSHNVPPGKVLSGIPAFDNREWLRSTAAFRRLGEMQRTLRALEQRLAALEKESSG